MGAVFKFKSVPADGWRPDVPAPAPAAPATDVLRLSVVVPTGGNLPTLMRCLEALLVQNLSLQSFEILVVDRARDKATRRAVQALARTLPPHLLHYLRPPDHETGTAAARNRGWRAARAPLIAFTEDHALPDPQWLVDGDRAIHRQRCVALVGPVIVQRASRDAGTATGHEPEGRLRQRAVFDSANAFVWRKALQAVGGFDDRFPDPAHEDADLQFRLQRQGPLGRSRSTVVIHRLAPARRGDSLRRQRDKFFDALLYREHPQDYRLHIGMAPVWVNYAVVSLALAALAALLVGSRPAAEMLALTAIATVAMLAVRRLRLLARPAGTAGNLLEVLATSALVPFLAVYWRLRGAWHYRVWFA